MNSKSSTQLARELSDAYSTPNYRGGWLGCVRMLRRRGYNDEQIECIIRSKWTRWATDMASRPYGRHTSSDLARFLDSMNPRLRDGGLREMIDDVRHAATSAYDERTQL